MVIIRLSDKTLSCSIAAQELQELGLTPRDLLEGDDKVAAFMARLNQEMGQQLDYDPENEVMVMSRNMLPDGGMRVIAVKMDNNDIQSSADRLRSAARGILEYLSEERVGRVLEAKGKEKGEALNELIEGMNNMMGKIYLQDGIQNPGLLEASDDTAESDLSSGADGSTASASPDKSRGTSSGYYEQPVVTTKPVTDYQRYMGTFPSLDDAIRFSRVVSSMPIVDSSLYKEGDQYYLMMGLRTASDAVVYELRRTGIEYAASLTVNSPEELHLTETGDCVIARDAVMHLADMS
ncbi:adaptor protein MecA [Butyrivibrio sp. MC2013]|uniref:adaptor protein MecA n=1 Tax=Butyrivibrio sp. MC2013 TaxID=1280686 RepID=UPI000406A912|nr:adaptor protein MecA [Butyrivibrio sp. MC2013]